MALISVAEALARVLDGVVPLPAETVALADGHRRALAADVAALRTQPPAAVSAMDGYAARAADVAHPPARLQVIGEVAAGRPFDGTVGPGEAARIFTGGVLPAGADTVVIQERTKRDGTCLIVTASSAVGRNVRAAGLDFAQGDVLLRAGRRLSDRDLALAAAMNHPTLPLRRAPRVALLATGDELVAPGVLPGPGQIVYSNGFGLAALARAEGAQVVDLGIVPDRIDATVRAIDRAAQQRVDVLVTTGGASVGDYDLVQPSLAARGMTLSFWKVALRPGRPMMHGALGPMRVLGLPGNPVSAYVCGFLFLVPLLRRLLGLADAEVPTEMATLGRALPGNDERADYLRASLARAPDGSLVATPFEVQDSSMVALLAEADCLLIREPHAPAVPAGSSCTIVKFDR
ncbi:MAG TPA: gephyrin-like molybdotransferase Glp [Xanthobacteraceae bacterium]|nr:gephyrin-like molybdotransferase Glp [Xanthobacteraceae bacterium]